jgi:hypothetical protein
VLQFAQRWTSRIDWFSFEVARELLTSSNAFIDPGLAEATGQRLLVVHQLLSDYQQRPGLCEGGLAGMRRPGPPSWSVNYRNLLYPDISPSAGIPQSMSTYPTSGWGINAHSGDGRRGLCRLAFV